MADGPSSPEFNIETSPLATPAEIQRAKKGVEQFQSVLGQVDRKTRKEVISGRGSEMLQSMLLGIKPICLPVYEEKTAFEVPQLSPFIKRTGDIFYDPQQVEQTISKYPEVFDDFDPGNGIDAYLKKVVETKKTSSAPQAGFVARFSRKRRQKLCRISREILPTFCSRCCNRAIWDGMGRNNRKESKNDFFY